MHLTLFSLFAFFLPFPPILSFLLMSCTSLSLPLILSSFSLFFVLVPIHPNLFLSFVLADRSGVIWQVEKARKKWKTLNNTIIAFLEEAHLKKEMDVKYKNLAVSTTTRILSLHTYPKLKSGAFDSWGDQLIH